MKKICVQEIVYVVAALRLEVGLDLVMNLVHAHILNFCRYAFLELLNVHCSSIYTWERQAIYVLKQSAMYGTQVVLC